jgi:Arc/MetJ-type ribon-helix-helix transcriptional regulator
MIMRMAKAPTKAISIKLPEATFVKIDSVVAQLAPFGNRHAVVKQAVELGLAILLEESKR